MRELENGKAVKARKGKNLKNGICWSTRTISYSAVNTLFVSYISLYATDVLGMAAGTIATVLLITKLLDGVTDLIAGLIVDNTHTKWGKGRPYDWCIPFIALFTILAFAVPNTSELVQAVYIGIMYALAQAVFATLLGASDNIYLLRAFPEEKERNSVYSISMIFGQIISIAVGVILPVMVTNAGTSATEWTKMVIYVTVPLAIIGMLRFFTIKEAVSDEVPKEEKAKEKKKDSVSFFDGMKAITQNKYIIFLSIAIFIIVVASGLMNTSAAYYFKYIVGDMNKMSLINMASLSSLIILVAFVPLANKFGKEKVMKVCLIIALLGGVVRWMGGTNMVTMVIGYSLLMFGIMPLTAYFPLFLFDIMDYGEWKMGKRVEGVIAVFPFFANKVASGLSVSAGSYILQFAGYDGTAVTQTQTALLAIEWTYNVLPIILLGVMVLIMVVFYNLEHMMPTVKKELEERKQAEIDENK